MSNNDKYTTIAITESIRQKIILFKLNKRETYNDVLIRIFEELENNGKKEKTKT